VERVIHTLVGLRKFQPQRIGSAAGRRIVARYPFSVPDFTKPSINGGSCEAVFTASFAACSVRTTNSYRPVSGGTMTGPAIRKAIGLEPLRVGPFDAEVKRHLRIDLLVDEVLRAVEAAAAEVFGFEAAAVVDARAATAKARHDVGDRVVILPYGEPGKFDAGGTVVIAGDW